MSGESPFGPAAVAKAVHTTLEDAYTALPAGTTHAVIFDGRFSTADGPIIRGLFVQKIDGGWQVVLEGDYSGSHGLAGQVAIARAW